MVSDFFINDSPQEWSDDDTYHKNHANYRCHCSFWKASFFNFYRDNHTLHDIPKSVEKSENSDSCGKKDFFRETDEIGIEYKDWGEKCDDKEIVFFQECLSKGSTDEKCDSTSKWEIPGNLLEIWLEFFFEIAPKKKLYRSKEESPNRNEYQKWEKCSKSRAHILMIKK